jgi:hypothetical protein
MVRGVHEGLLSAGCNACTLHYTTCSSSADNISDQLDAMQDCEKKLDV